VSYYGEKYESCFIHILQFIPLPTLTCISSPLADNTISSLVRLLTFYIPPGLLNNIYQLDSFIPSLHRIHQCGIAHNDLSRANVLVQIENTSSSQSPQIVSKVYFIDFAMSVETDTNSIKNDGDRLVLLPYDLRFRVLVDSPFTCSQCCWSFKATQSLRFLWISSALASTASRGALCDNVQKRSSQRNAEKHLS